MEDSVNDRFWCHMCSRRVNPVLEAEIKCPVCDSGFVEEMDGRGGILTPLAQICNRMGGSRRRRPRRDEDDDDSDHQDRDRGTELALLRRRRSSALLHLLLGLHSGQDTERGESDRDPLILISPFNPAIIVQGSSHDDGLQNPIGDFLPTAASVGDYFVGSGLDLLLQHLSENDPNRYGTPPAKKEAVDALPTVKVEENLSCSVCLEDFARGEEAKEMPCKHRFHSGCILPWLELHSSCPVCRLQIPADETPRMGPGRVVMATEGWRPLVRIVGDREEVMDSCSMAFQWDVLLAGSHGGNVAILLQPLGVTLGKMTTTEAIVVIIFFFLVFFFAHPSLICQYCTVKVAIVFTRL
ncbi:unnamed protein product [Spirodela intermedia]|uniref:RING-type E3 ubiquitin transferase n=1 Tax=Spirodela intermedia TaxID=51605 RepID=A0A7I8JGD3_SPIIN|nr:unnamed protein product [Spirodela intermedia]CAA6669196.1 unnamed protein product [Spirodela intermedia]